MSKYIDIVLAKAAMKKKHDQDVELYGGVDIVECFPSEDAISILNTIPTADVAPVIHGHWKESSIEFNTYTCSNCDGVIALLEGTPNENMYYYCPNCGAKMEEERK